MRNILLVDDEEIFRETLSEFLGFENYRVTSASNGKIALDLITSDAKFDIIITDIQMPDMTGVELLQTLIARADKTPVVLMTGYTSLLETRSAFDLGASDFISKPFKCDELMLIVKRLLPDSLSIDIHMDQARGDKNIYVEIPVWSIVSRQSIDLDVFIKLGNTRFLKIIKAGQTIDIQRLTQYQKKGLTSLYIREEDAVKLSKKTGIETTLIEPVIEDTKRSDFVHYFKDRVSKLSISAKLKKDQFIKLSDFSDLVALRLFENSELKSTFDLLEGFSQELILHSLSTMVYSFLLACEQETTVSDEDMMCLALASLFHDVGETKLEKELIAKKESQLSDDEKVKYFEHVFTSWLMLENIPGINPMMLRLISEHHEHLDGSGFPQGLKDDEVHSLARILGLASKFSKLIYMHHSQLIISDINALNIITKKHKTHFPDSLLRKLEQLVAIQEDKREESKPASPNLSETTTSEFSADVDGEEKISS